MVHFNDLDIGLINLDRNFKVAICFDIISETTRDRAIVNIESQ